MIEVVLLKRMKVNSMDELFLQELNAITNYANNSDTNFTEEVVREMLTNLLNMEKYQLYGNRCCPAECYEKKTNKKE